MKKNSNMVNVFEFKSFERNQFMCMCVSILFLQMDSFFLFHCLYHTEHISQAITILNEYCNSNVLFVCFFCGNNLNYFQN